MMGDKVPLEYIASLSKENDYVVLFLVSLIISIYLVWNNEQQRTCTGTKLSKGHVSLCFSEKLSVNLTPLLCTPNN